MRRFKVKIKFADGTRKVFTAIHSHAISLLLQFQNEYELNEAKVSVFRL